MPITLCAAAMLLFLFPKNMIILAVRAHTDFKIGERSVKLFLSTVAMVSCSIGAPLIYNSSY